MKNEIYEDTHTCDCEPPDFDGIEFKDDETTPAVENTHIGKAFDILKQALQEDEEYAWSWHCNLAVPFMDEGGSHKSSNKAAARIMYNFFRVDTSKSKYFKDLGFNIKSAYAEAISHDQQHLETQLNRLKELELLMQSTKPFLYS